MPVLVPLVDPATAGPISESSRSWSLNAYITVKVWIIFFAGPFFESFYDLGLKKGGPCPESRVGPLSESDNTLCEWGNILWSVFRDGSLCEAVR